MISKPPVNIRSFKQKVRHNKNRFKRFLTKLEKKAPRGIEKITARLEKEVWNETDCLTCANCCKTMTPTFTNADVKRIAAHFGETPAAFREKWLYKEKKGTDWMNKKEPCQFLNLKNNKCSIYDIRPADCVGFPHLPKKMKYYAHVHKQNIEYCPATYRIVEKMMTALKKVN